MQLENLQEVNLMKPKFINAVLSDHATAFSFLSRESFAKYNAEFPEINMTKRRVNFVNFIKNKAKEFKDFNHSTGNFNIPPASNQNKYCDLFDEPEILNKLCYNSIDDELEVFLNIKSSHIMDKFWFEYQKQIPTLALIYRQLKSIPPSNSFFERLFSIGKLIFSDLKSKTSK